MNVHMKAFEDWCELHDHRTAGESEGPVRRTGKIRPLCKAFAEGTCLYGRRCKFWHSEPPINYFVDFSHEPPETSKIPYRNADWFKTLQADISTDEGSTSSDDSSSSDSDELISYLT